MILTWIQIASQQDAPSILFLFSGTVSDILDLVLYSVEYAALGQFWNAIIKGSSTFKAYKSIYLFSTKVSAVHSSTPTQYQICAKSLTHHWQFTIEGFYWDLLWMS
jgi:hypothetical protein